MDDFVAILKTEYSTAFDEHRKKAVEYSVFSIATKSKESLRKSKILSLLSILEEV